MAYYSKQQIYDFLESEKIRLNTIGLSFLTSEDEIIMNLENESNVVALFWLEPENEKINMNGKSFFRIDHDLYTDDRFALDSFVAADKNISVSELIKARSQDSNVLKEKKLDSIDILYKILTKK